MKMKPILVALAAGLLASSAHSAVITTAGVTYWAVDAGALYTEANRTDWTSSFNVGLFDTSLGNLMSVNLTLWGEVGSIFEVTSHNQGSRAATLNSEGEIITDLLGVSVTPFGNFRTPEIARNESYTSGMILARDELSISFDDLATLATWMGSGFRSIGVSAYGNSYVSGAGNVSSQVDTWARASLTVSYTYYEVPEPLPLALLGAGLLGLVAVRRRIR